MTLIDGNGTRSKPRVLLLLHELSRTGAPKIPLQVIAALRGRVDVRTVALEGGALEADCAALGPLLILGRDRHGRLWHRAHARRVQRRAVLEIHRWRPDVIYINSIASLPIARAIDLPEAPALLHVHELDSYLDRAMAEYPDLLTRWPGRFVAVSGAVARALEGRCGIDPARIALVNEFVPEHLMEGRGPRRHRDSREGFVVGGAGFPSWRKGLSLWLQMVAETRRLLGPGVQFTWVGVPEGSAGDPFRTKARLMGLEGVVEFVPSTPTPLEHYARFDVFAMTSWEDPCPIVVLEAMMLGVPVVCFAGSGGSPEEVGESGLVIDNFDPREMARRIAELASRPEERSRLGALARSRVRENFTSRTQVPKLLRELEATRGS